MTHTVETITVFAVEATIQSGTFRRTSTEFSECGLKSVKFKASSVFLSPEPNMGHIVLYFCSVYDRRSPGWHAKRPILFPVFMPPPPPPTALPCTIRPSCSLFISSQFLSDAPMCGRRELCTGSTTPASLTASVRHFIKANVCQTRPILRTLAQTRREREKSVFTDFLTGGVPITRMEGSVSDLYAAVKRL